MNPENDGSAGPGMEQVDDAPVAAQCAVSACSNQDYGPQQTAVAGIPFWDASSGPLQHESTTGTSQYGAVMGNNEYGAKARSQPYAAAASAQSVQLYSAAPGVQLGSSTPGMQPYGVTPGTQQYGPAAGTEAAAGPQEAAAVGTLPYGAASGPHAAGGQPYGAAASPQLYAAQMQYGTHFGAAASVDASSSPEGSVPAVAQQYGVAAGAQQYSAAALAQYYAAAAAGGAQYAASGQPLDPLQQATLAQYSLYAAAYAAQAAGGGTGVPGHDGPSNAWINNRLIEREKARLDRNFDEADKIRAELRQRGVEVDDRLRTWSCRDGRRGHRPNHNDIPEAE